MKKIYDVNMMQIVCVNLWPWLIMRIDVIVWCSVIDCICQEINFCCKFSVRSDYKLKTVP